MFNFVIIAQMVNFANHLHRAITKTPGIATHWPHEKQQGAGKVGSQPGAG
jgi:hypothetical protein